MRNKTLSDDFENVTYINQIRHLMLSRDISQLEEIIKDLDNANLSYLLVVLISEQGKDSRFVDIVKKEVLLRT